MGQRWRRLRRAGRARRYFGAGLYRQPGKRAEGDPVHQDQAGGGGAEHGPGGRAGSDLGEGIFAGWWTAARSAAGSRHRRTRPGSGHGTAGCRRGPPGATGLRSAAAAGWLAARRGGGSRAARRSADPASSEAVRRRARWSPRARTPRPAARATGQREDPGELPQAACPINIGLMCAAVLGGGARTRFRKYSAGASRSGAVITRGHDRWARSPCEVRYGRLWAHGLAAVVAAHKSGFGSRSWRRASPPFCTVIDSPVIRTDAEPTRSIWRGALFRSSGLSSFLRPGTARWRCR